MLLTYACYGVPLSIPYIVCVCYDVCRIFRMAPEVVVCETIKDNPYDCKVLYIYPLL